MAERRKQKLSEKERVRHGLEVAVVTVSHRSCHWVKLDLRATDIDLKNVFNPRGNFGSFSISPKITTLTTWRRMTCKHANYFHATERRASKHTFWFLCVSAGRLVNMPHVACHHGDRCVYTPSFLRVPGVTVGWPRTEVTANNERIHSFCGFLPNPFIQDLCLWRTSQEFVKTDLYLLSRGLWSLAGMPSVRPGAGR